MTNLNNPQVILEIINHIKGQNLKSTTFDYSTIFNKLTFKDRTFFKIFTQNENKSPTKSNIKSLKITSLRTIKKTSSLNMSTSKQNRKSDQ